MSQTLALAFASAGSVVDFQALSDALQAWYQKWPDDHFLHPCVIERRPALVCRANLRETQPLAFAELQAIASYQGIYLKQDSRQSSGEHKGANRRHNSSAVLVFCLSLLAASRAVTAHDLQSVTSNSSASPFQMPISGMQVVNGTSADGAPIIQLKRARPPSAEQVLAAYQTKLAKQTVNLAHQALISDFLKKTYHAQTDDPSTIAADLQEIAEYYAGYPQAVELIQSLVKHNVVLSYRKGSWQAQAWGDKHRVDSVTIHFDTRTGAQLLDAPGCEANPACSISAADALLHELLHAKLMLLDSENFIADGGMQGHVYPHDHEQEVLALENQLYQAMNQTDGLARPLRQRHSGGLQEIVCAVCTPGMQIASSEGE
jgi:hypothetical protein